MTTYLLLNYSGTDSTFCHPLKEEVLKSAWLQVFLKTDHCPANKNTHVAIILFVLSVMNYYIMLPDGC